MSWSMANVGDDRKQAEAEQVLFFDVTSDMLCVMDQQGRVLSANPALQARCKGEAVGVGLAELVNDDARAAVSQALADLTQGRTRQARLTLGLGRPRGALVELVLDAQPGADGLRVFGAARETLATQARDDRFRAVYENSDDSMFFFDVSGGVLDANPAACGRLGYTRAELLELNVKDIFALPQADFTARVHALGQHPEPSFASLHKHRAGSLIPVHVTLRSLAHAGHDAIVVIARDLTERERFQEEVRETRDRLQTILQTLPDLLFEIDETGVVMQFFSVRADLLSMPVQRFMHRSLREISEPEAAETMMGCVRSALEHGYASGVQYQSGNERWFEMSAARRAVPAGERARVIALARDITERKQREQELLRINDELTRFTYTVSHDLKSPLVTIKSFLGYLRQDLAVGDAERIERDLGHIENAAGRMVQLLDDLLELSRVGRKVNPPQRVSLQELVSEARQLVAGRIAMNGAHIHVTDEPAQLWGDRTRLLEVFQNLIDNAIKFVKPGEAAEVSIEVERGSHEGELVVCVHDRGIGIDPRHQHKLFGLFEKLHADADGTGIGLALVKRIIEVHGGRIWIDSAGEGKGTSVRFTLPRTKEESAA